MRRGGEARGARALRSPAWRGSAGIAGAPGAAQSQLSQRGMRCPRLSHRGERLRRLAGDQAEVARHSPPAVA